MTAGKKVSILLHKQARYDATRHPLIWYLAEFWKESGIDIEILQGIPDEMPSCDVLIAHIDLTVVPAEYVDFINRFPIVINGRLTDISKRRISSNLLGPDDSYAGQVIIKTDKNYGGLPELQFGRRSGDRSMFMTEVQRPWRKVQCLNPENYPIFESKNDVPSGVWRNPNLVVEKFIPERDGDLYSKRGIFFMGEKNICERAFGYSPILKANGTIRTESIDAPVELTQIQLDLGLDYGKIDYVVHDGEIHILDVNKTLGGVADDDINREYVRPLVDGLWPFLDAADSS